MDGYAIKFSNDGQLRYVAVSEEGAINWFDHTTKGDYPDKNLGILWTTDFDIKVVGETKTVDNYGSWENPTHFGFPVKMTRSDNDKADITKEGYYYYATLKLPFAVDLTSAVDKYGTKYDLSVFDCTSKTNVVGQEVGLTDITSSLEYNTLPRETPVLLRMGTNDTPAYDATQITLYLQPALARTITETGFKGTLGKKKFQNTDNTADNYYDPSTNANFFILGKKTDGRVKFYYMSNQVLAANKAYYVYNGTTSAKSLVFRFDDDNISTGISLPETIETSGDAVIYDLSGRRVAGTAKKGVYIRNGKKYIVK